jgi:hypothetical protein
MAIRRSTRSTPTKAAPRTAGNADRARPVPPTAPVLTLPEGETYRVLSVRQPWAWAIIHAGKDVENRPRRSHYRGPLLIHASAAKPDPGAVHALRELVAEVHGGSLTVPDTFATGELIGLVEMVDCVQGARSPWAERGSFHLKLASPQPVSSGTALTGQLGIWTWTVGTASHGWSRKSARE